MCGMFLNLILKVKESRGTSMELVKLLLSNYLPYAKSTIISRAIPSIDGLKPVQRRLLYTMFKMGLLNGDKAKSQRINGQTMAIHPHGDSSIYESMVLMSSGYGGLNVPYIESKGSFGKVYSKDLKYAAPRYTEAKLAKICNEMFEGINEGAVEFIDNFDATEKEPTLLPVKFPSILVNASSGVAVGTSSDIPSFSLKNTCLAAQEIINGTITTPAELAKVLGAPEFTTGGYLHADEKSLEKLCATGKGSFVISGHVQVYSNQIVIDEIPYCTTAETIIEEITEHIKNKTEEFRGIKDVRDEIGLEGLRIVVEIKGGYNSREILKTLCRMTSLRTKMSFRTRVIVSNRCKEMGLLELLNTWVDFRQLCIQNVYTCRLEKDKEKKHLLSTWGLIKDDITNVVQMISKNTDAVAKELLMKNYGLDSAQADYLLDMKIRSITTDRAEKALKELADIIARVEYVEKVVKDVTERKKIIYDELTEIINKYGTDNKTVLAPELTESDNKPTEVKISDELTTVIYTREGYIKRLVGINNLGKYSSTNGDEEVLRWTIRNNQHLLVFDRFGTVHKILVDDIDSGRGKLVDKLHEKAGLEKAEDLIWADACGDYSGYFNLIYPNGRGTRVYYSDAKPEGNRSTYKIGYAEVKPGQYWITTENQFFMITKRKKAAYCDITRLGIVSNRSAFKIGRVSNGDWFTQLVPTKNIENLAAINLNKYHKDYTVSMGIDYDIMFPDPELSKRVDEMLEAECNKYKTDEELAEEAKKAAEASESDNETSETTSETEEDF